MKTIEVNLYEFSELSDKIKEKIINNHYDGEDYPFLNEDILSELENQENFFKNVKLAYSLSNCQGDGLSLQGEFDLERWLKEKTTLKVGVQKALMELIYKIYSTGSQGRHYQYCSKSGIQYEFNTDKEYSNVTTLFTETILPQIISYYINTCKKLEEYGYSILEYRMDKKEFEEFSHSNAYLYYDTGELYYS